VLDIGLGHLDVLASTASDQGFKVKLVKSNGREMTCGNNSAGQGGRGCAGRGSRSRSTSRAAGWIVIDRGALSCSHVIGAQLHD
jgi:hypothetical protein